MTAPIERERTALSRTGLSSPMQHLLRYGFLDDRHSIFDYGCGRGDDLRMLERMNIPATGWDPVFRPDTQRKPADIVNLGFVLNVIEDARERNATLKSAFQLAEKILVVSVMLGHQAKREQFDQYQDGVRTQRNTFQKYYAQDEFRAYLESTLKRHAIPIAPGTCLVFRNQMDEQLFHLARQQVRREWRLLRRDPNDAAISALVEDHREQVDAYWREALELGRPPMPEECTEAQSLIRLVGSWRRVHEWVGRFFNPEELEAAAIGRQEDLLVYFALAYFAKRRSYSELPERLQRDVRYFFGSITKARNAGKRALFAVGDNARVEEAAVFCHDELGIGMLAERHDLTFHQSLLGECLPLIRIYVGCALQLFGDAGSVDLIKVHLQSGKVTFLVYDNFRGSQTPNLIERIKVDLSRLQVDFFDYLDEYEPQPLKEERENFFLH